LGPCRRSGCCIETSANIVIGSVVSLNIAAAAARNFALFNFVPAADKISLSGYDSSTISNAIINQVRANRQMALTLGDQTQIQLAGTTRAAASFFG